MHIYIANIIYKKGTGRERAAYLAVRSGLWRVWKVDGAELESETMWVSVSVSTVVDLLNVEENEIIQVQLN